MTTDSSTTVRIPRTLSSAERTLNEIGGLVTAKEWERAAVVAAFTIEGKPGPGDRIAGDAISIREFARKGIIGLASQNTIRRYRDAWKATGRVAAPGKTVDLADLPEWSSVFDASDSGGRPRAPMAEIVERVRRDPEYADRLVEQVTEARPEVITPTRIATAITRTPGMAEKVLRTSPAAKQALGQAQVTGWEREQHEAGIETPRRGDEHGYLITSGLISSARAKIREAVREVGPLNLTSAHQEDLLGGLGLLENAISLLRSAIETGDKSFEDELAALLGEAEAGTED